MGTGRVTTEIPAGFEDLGVILALQNHQGVQRL